MAARPKTFSARWDADVVDRLDRRSALAGTSKSRLAERYVDEGTRMDEHPGILFRGGPAGRRAALAAGPDVWEVVSTMRGAGAKGEEAIATTAETLNLTPQQVRTAVRYYSDYPEKIDERVRRNIEEADAAEAAWRREQAALG
jgi:uncharacterized protein (DUF433 family)